MVRFWFYLKFYEDETWGPDAIHQLHRPWKFQDVLFLWEWWLGSHHNFYALWNDQWTFFKSWKMENGKWRRLFSFIDSGAGKACFDTLTKAEGRFRHYDHYYNTVHYIPLCFVLQVTSILRHSSFRWRNCAVLRKLQ